jgi:hypothetical protein
VAPPLDSILSWIVGRGSAELDCGNLVPENSQGAASVEVGGHQQNTMDLSFVSRPADRQAAGHIPSLIPRRKAGNRASSQLRGGWETAQILPREFQLTPAVDVAAARRIEDEAGSQTLREQLQAFRGTLFGLARQDYDGVGRLGMIDNQPRSRLTAKQQTDDDEQKRPSEAIAPQFMHPSLLILKGLLASRRDRIRVPSRVLKFAFTVEKLSYANRTGYTCL